MQLTSFVGINIKGGSSTVKHWRHLYLALRCNGEKLVTNDVKQLWKYTSNQESFINLHIQRDSRLVKELKHLYLSDIYGGGGGSFETSLSQNGGPLLCQYTSNQ